MDFNGGSSTGDGAGFPPNPTGESVLAYRTDREWNAYNYDTTGRIFDGDMTITGALSVNEIISDLEIKDAQISLNKDAPNDNNASGVVLLNTNNTRYSGLLKQGNSNDFYLFANSATLPTPLNWTPEQSGHLFANRTALGTNNNTGATLSVRPVANLEQGLIVRKPFGHVADLIRCIDEVKAVTFFSVGPEGQVTCNSLAAANEIASRNLQVGSSGNDYKLPNQRATAPGQIIIAGAGQTTTWEDIPIAASLESLLGTSSITLVGNVTTMINDTIPRVLLDPTKTELKSPDGLKYITLDNNQLTYRDEGLIRLGITDVLSSLQSPDTVTDLSIFNTSANFSSGSNIWFEMTNAEKNIRDGLNEKRLIITNNESILQADASNTTGLNMSRATNTISLKRDNTTVFNAVNNVTTISNNIGGELRLGEGPAGTRIRRGGQTRLQITGTGTQLLSPNGSDFFVGDNNLNVELQDGGGIVRVRQNFDTTQSTFNSPDGLEKIRFTDTDLRIGGVQPRIFIDANDNIINSADGQEKLKITNSEFKIGGNYTVPIVSGTEGQFLEVGFDGNFNYRSNRRYCNIQAETKTTLSMPLIGQYYVPINNIVLGTLSDGFTGTDGKITYNLDYKTTVKVSAHVSVQRVDSGVPSTFNLAVLRNGVKTPGSCRFQLDDGVNFPVEASFETIVELDPQGAPATNELQLALSSETVAAVDVDVYSYSFTVTQL